MNASHRRLELSVLPETFAIVRLASNAQLPAWATEGKFFSVTRTADELSMVCPFDQVPAGTGSQTRWRALKVHGPFALSEVGVLAALSAPLAEAQVSIFVLSTYDTDYLLVKSEQLSKAIDALQRAGHQVHEAGAAV